VNAAASEELEVGALLCARLVDPCLAALGSERPGRVFVVLDDFLHLVPLEALPLDGAPDAVDVRLGETLTLRTETTVLRLVAPARTAAANGTLLVLGGIDFGAQGSARSALLAATPPIASNRSGARASFQPLIQSRYEAEAVGGLFEELTGGEPLIFLRGDATKRALAEHAASARYLHIATHGWFASESGAVSMLDRVGADEGQRAALELSVDRAQDTIVGFLPETLCGLALAGANNGVDEHGRVPGIFTAEELATLDLSNCELAVLSACETNVGIRRAGQGIQSLQTALHAAGARTAITSLWKVDDAATRRLFELFYTKLWSDELGHADALWQAKMALRSEGHPTRDWAGWVLTGDPD